MLTAKRPNYLNYDENVPCTVLVTRTIVKFVEEIQAFAVIGAAHFFVVFAVIFEVIAFAVRALVDNVVLKIVKGFLFIVDAIKVTCFVVFDNFVVFSLLAVAPVGFTLVIILKFDAVVLRGNMLSFGIITVVVVFFVCFVEVSTFTVATSGGFFMVVFILADVIVECINMKGLFVSVWCAVVVELTVFIVELRTVREENTFKTAEKIFLEIVESVVFFWFVVVFAFVVDSVFNLTVEILWVFVGFCVAAFYVDVVLNTLKEDSFDIDDLIVVVICVLEVIKFAEVFVTIERYVALEIVELVLFDIVELVLFCCDFVYEFIMDSFSGIIDEIFNLIEVVVDWELKLIEENVLFLVEETVEFEISAILGEEMFFIVVVVK